MLKKILCYFVCFFCFLHSSYASTLLEVPENLIALNTEPGQKLFKATPDKYLNDYWPLSQYFVTERGLAFCAPASIVIVLNALGKTPKVAPEHYPYKLFNQTNLFFNSEILNANITPAMINFQGMTLDKAAFVLKHYANEVKTYHGNEIMGVKQFREMLIKTLMTKNQFIIINFYRKTISESGGGHFSPIAAYNPETDRFLILDVARYKYPPVWVKAEELLKAILGIDSTSKKARGFIIVS
ncbi:phytochelatin synthase family protein [Thiotrichales bacterium 19S3-7]|nr:phytochelatin synthase family protein [Thiotrichales bacterium 19S3-7]MCF6800629.1 phytochelatin synthase family protein [Thiotrichales bacterium 19S3-11]